MSGTAQWDGAPFSGAKIIAYAGPRLLVYRRDNKPGIPFPGLLDLPGGGREHAENPDACALRELFEEFGLDLPGTRIDFRQPYLISAGRPPGWLLALKIDAADIAAIRFGDEGEDWRLMEFGAFLADSGAVPHLQVQVRAFLAAGSIRVF